MTKSITTLLARTPAKPRGDDAPTPRAAMALAKSKAYQDAADAPATLKAYATDWANFYAWCIKHGFTPMPATPEVVGAFLAAAGEGYALPTLRRRVAAIARACRIAGHPLDTKAPAIPRNSSRYRPQTRHPTTPFDCPHHCRYAVSWYAPAARRSPALATAPFSSLASQAPCAVRSWSA